MDDSDKHSRDSQFSFKGNVNKKEKDDPRIPKNNTAPVKRLDVKKSKL